MPYTYLCDAIFDFYVASNIPSFAHKVSGIGVNRPDLGGTCPALPADVLLSCFHFSMSRFGSINILA